MRISALVFIASIASFCVGGNAVRYSATSDSITVAEIWYGLDLSPKYLPAKESFLRRNIQSITLRKELFRGGDIEYIEFKISENNSYRFEGTEEILKELLGASDNKKFDYIYYPNSLFIKLGIVLLFLSILDRHGFLTRSFLDFHRKCCEKYG